LNRRGGRVRIRAEFGPFRTGQEACPLLSTTAEYALRIMVALTEAASEPLTCDEISRRTRVPAGYALKVLQWLREKKLVASQRGRKGGVRIVCDPEETTLLDVVNAIEPVERIRTCPLGRREHRGRLCPLHSRLDELIVSLLESLEDLSLDAVAHGGKGPPLCRAEGGEAAARGRGGRATQQRPRRRRRRRK